MKRRYPSRRDLLRGLGVGTLLATVEPSRLRAALHAPAAAGGGRFLTATELDTLRAVTARLLPGPPEDADPGAVEAGCAEAIDALLGAFTFDPPLIHAGGPFSDRAGAPHDDMAAFVPLDPLAELGWRIRLEGSLGTDTLADFVALVLSDAIDVMYGPPEYGGNHGLVGWTATQWPGDVQPRGYTPAQVRELDPPATSLDAGTARDALSRYVLGITLVDPPGSR